MGALLKHVGTADWDRDWLNMSVNTPASWSAARDAARDAVWAGSLARIKCFTHVGCGEVEPAGFGSGPCQWHCFVLKASKEVV